MDLHMDLRVGFNEDFTFGGQPISCSSASSSFSSASTSSSLHDPFTPTSGRSTPGVQPVFMDHDNLPCSASRGFDLTPPASAFGGYFPPEVKSEFNHYTHCDTLPATPSRKASIQTTTMDFEYHPMMPPHLASHGNHHMESTNPHTLGHFPFVDHMGSSPLAFPTPPAYSFESDGPSMWAWPGESPINVFERHASPALSSPVKPHSLRGDRHSLALANHGRRRLYVDEVQQKTSALHRVQHGQCNEAKRERGRKSGLVGGIQLIAKGTFRCDHPDCIAMGRNPFKRQEHLKRHKSTCHNPNPEESNTECPFCKRCFNRKDNWRQHLKLHTTPNRTISRTDYHPEAKALYDAEMKKTKQRSQSRKKSAKVES
ncbi:hypothetical protein F4809DRAFT_652141 [Biscogniauxia mediterranea]|nr:hypothetical protein F4809DRAFT_652141 [Biscogniauxia mediterranea]